MCLSDTSHRWLKMYFLLEGTQIIQEILMALSWSANAIPMTYLLIDTLLIYTFWIELEI